MASINVFLVVLVSIVAVLLLGVCVFILVYYGHPDDSSGALLPKIITVFGLFMAFASVLVLPYDVANSRGEGGGLSISILWQIIYITFAVLITAIIPFAFFFYESDVDPEVSHGFCNGQCGSAIKYTLVFFISFVVLIVILYATSRTAEIPVQRYAQSPSLVSPIARQVSNQGTRTVKTFPGNITRRLYLGGCQEAYGCVANTFVWQVDVTFPIYVMALLGFIGWFLFTFFVGVGFFALPMDLINAWRTRPVAMDSVKYFAERQHMGERASKLRAIAEQLKKGLSKVGAATRGERRKTEQNYKKFMKFYYFLKKDIEVLEVAHKLKGGNPLIPFGQLILGIIGLVLSITWIVHIIIYVLPSPPLHPFLNNFFIALEEAFGAGNTGLLGVLAFAIYSFWLLACAVKGNFKLGMRFLVWKIYPMELHKTFMNAFLFNTWLILLCAVPTVQFCAWAFPVYARYTDVNQLFGNQIKYLPGFRSLWTNNIFIYVMVVVAFLSLFVFIISPNDRSKEVDKEIAELEKADALPPSMREKSCCC